IIFWSEDPFDETIELLNLNETSILEFSTDDLFKVLYDLFAQGVGKLVEDNLNELEVPEVFLSINLNSTPFSVADL
ncbi:hypothetical protein, partial [Algibacter sp.]|uniref:hypothetical protein n=1 Tax=Algibacter sp. TaxID=1872428 RepID=UPI003C74EEDE